MSLVVSLILWQRKEFLVEHTKMPNQMYLGWAFWIFGLFFVFELIFEELDGCPSRRPEYTIRTSTARLRWWNREFFIGDEATFDQSF